MKTVLPYLAIAAVVGLLGLGIVTLAARLTPGPLGPFPGAAFEGSAYTGEVDWVAVQEVRTIALQVNAESPRTITTLVVGHDDQIYVPSAVAARKVWPSQVLEDPRVVLRIARRLYPRRAVRVTDPGEIDAVREALAAKYGSVPGEEDLEGTWIFRMEEPAH